MLDKENNYVVDYMKLSDEIYVPSPPESHVNTCDGFHTLEPSENEDVETILCAQCGGTPCYQVQLREIIVETVDGPCTIYGQKEETTDYEGLRVENTADMTMSEKRKLAYKTYVGERNGYLGPVNRFRIPHCITNVTKRLWNDPDGAYMGFKEF